MDATKHVWYAERAWQKIIAFVRKVFAVKHEIIKRNEIKKSIIFVYLDRLAHSLPNNHSKCSKEMRNKSTIYSVHVKFMCNLWRVKISLRFFLIRSRIFPFDATSNQHSCCCRSIPCWIFAAFSIVRDVRYSLLLPSFFSVARVLLRIKNVRTNFLNELSLTENLWLEGIVDAYVEQMVCVCLCLCYCACAYYIIKREQFKALVLKRKNDIYAFSQARYPTKMQRRKKVVRSPESTVYTTWTWTWACKTASFAFDRISRCRPLCSDGNGEVSFEHFFFLSLFVALSLFYLIWTMLIYLFCMLESDDTDGMAVSWLLCCCCLLLLVLIIRNEHFFYIICFDAWNVFNVGRFYQCVFCGCAFPSCIFWLLCCFRSICVLKHNTWA